MTHSLNQRIVDLLQDGAHHHEMIILIFYQNDGLGRLLLRWEGGKKAGGVPVPRIS